MTTDAALRELVPGLLGIYGDLIDSVILYGSVARGTQTDESDVDVAVIMHPGATAEMHDRMLDGFDSSKHSGVIAHFNQQYVKTGVFEKNASKIIRGASELREQADYEDFYSATREEADETPVGAQTFIDMVEKFLAEKRVI